MDIQISDNISFRESVRSAVALKHGIENIPDCEAMRNMSLVAKHIFEPLRKGLGGFKIFISSFFRNRATNIKAGGSRTSKHITGQAIDVDADVYGIVTNEEIFNYIKDNLEFDKLIWEYGDDDEPDWVHVSYVEGKNRGLVYRARRIKGKPIYTQI